ncbi:MAG: glycerophosphodiester phosphodiesterase family protein [Hellea sp.]
MLPLKNLISHRFRGFAPHENTIAGLNAALDFGVLNLEFDIRVAKCGTPMIYHDEFALDKTGTAHRLSEVMASDYAALGGVFAHMPSAETLFAAMGQHANKEARFLIDIKDAGFEAEIHALVMLNRLASRVIYVSWVPEALYAMHALAPEADYCLSHWCQNPNAKTRRVHKVFEAKMGHLKRPRRKMVHGERSGWFVDGPLRGKLRDIVTSVCVPQAMVSRALVDDYHKDGIEVSTFSYVEWDHIQRHKERFNIDSYFIDNKRVFDEM